VQRLDRASGCCRGSPRRCRTSSPVGIAGANPPRPCTCPTKRVMRAKRPNPASCASKRLRKNEPDWRKSPPNTRGLRKCAWSAASAPRLAACEHRRPVGRRLRGHCRHDLGRQSVRVARGRRIRLVAVAGRRAGALRDTPAPRRSPRDGRAGGRATSNPQYSGPSWTMSSGNGRSGSVSAADQSSAGSVPWRRRLSSSSTWSDPCAASSSSIHSGGS
jgi:hypothetical protein